MPSSIHSIVSNGFSVPDRSLFFSRKDPSDLRLGDCVQALPLDETSFSKTPTENVFQGANVIAGYPDDEGIHTNGGRTGAAKAPDTVRKYLYKMTPSLLGASTARAIQELAHSPDARPRFLDLGNLSSSTDLLNRHLLAQTAAKSALESGARWIAIGGGHDYGFPDAAAYIEWAQSRGERPLILNFDAHLDVRPLDRGLSSGTPFFRMLDTYPDVDFAEIGIQTQCNSRAHFAWAQARGSRILTQEEVLISGESFCTEVLNLLGDWLLKRRSVFLSIDIDGFTSMAAPGCSQSWSTGFSPSEFFATLQVIIGRLDVRALGIYEVSPPLDRDDQTSKLAAQIIHRVVSQ